MGSSSSEFKKRSMSGKGGREVSNTGTNNQGNDYRSYSDGAYSYRNTGNDGTTTSSTYYNTGSGYAFYESKTGGYSYHENAHTGERSYQESGSGNAGTKK